MFFLLQVRETLRSRCTSVAAGPPGSRGPSLGMSACQCSVSVNSLLLGGLKNAGQILPVQRIYCPCFFLPQCKIRLPFPYLCGLTKPSLCVLRKNPLEFQDLNSCRFSYLINIHVDVD